MAAFSTLRGFGWCFSMCFPNFWLDVYILSQSLQSNFPMSILWVRLCCVRYPFVWTFFRMFHSWISSLLVFLFSLCLSHNLTGVFANYPSVCTHSYTFHTQTCFLCEFSCALQAYPLPHLCHKRCTFQLCGHFQCASSKYILCGTFCHRCYSLIRFLVVFSVVFVETKWTAEFFSTISTLILNVHRSKSGSQVKSLTIFKTVSTFIFDGL